jgi:hypothetical protein
MVNGFQRLGSISSRQQLSPKRQTGERSTTCFAALFTSCLGSTPATRRTCNSNWRLPLRLSHSDPEPDRVVIHHNIRRISSDPLLVFDQPNIGHDNAQPPAYRCILTAELLFLAMQANLPGQPSFRDRLSFNNCRNLFLVRSERRRRLVGIV